MTIPKAVIFDMDGLMLDTEAISLAVMSRTLRMFKIEFDEQWLHDIIGMNGAGANAYLTKQIGHPLPDTLDYSFLKAYEEYVTINGIELKTGLIELLKFLDENNIQRAVATSTRNRMAHKKLGMTGIKHWFEAIVCGDEVENGKPAPDIYLKAASLIGVDPENCMALEDSNNGAKAAYAANIDVIVVPDLKAPTDHTKQIAHMVVSDLHDVKRHLNSLLSQGGNRQEDAHSAA